MDPVSIEIELQAPRPPRVVVADVDLTSDVQGLGLDVDREGALVTLQLRPGKLTVDGQALVDMVGGAGSPSGFLASLDDEALKARAMARLGTLGQDPFDALLHEIKVEAARRDGASS